MADQHADEAKGRLKEAAGSLTGDDKLRREGSVDRASASVKDVIDKAAERVRLLLNRAK